MRKIESYWAETARLGQVLIALREENTRLREENERLLGLVRAAQTPIPAPFRTAIASLPDETFPKENAP